MLMVGINRIGRSEICSPGDLSAPRVRSIRSTRLITRSVMATFNPVSRRFRLYELNGIRPIGSRRRSIPSTSA